MCAQVAIVYNGPSPSRYTAAGEDKAVIGVLEAVEAVYNSLMQLGNSVSRVPLVLPVESARRELEKLKTDLVFNRFEGFPGYPETEALIPELLSMLGIPCTGCPAPVLKLALDKAETKRLLKEAGIATPDYQVLNSQTLLQFRLRFPCIVKPVAEDASHGLSPDSVVNDITALKRHVEAVSRNYGSDAIVEEFIDGREFNVTVLGNRECTVLPPSEIDYALPAGVPRLLTFAAKWETDSLYYKGTGVVCPAKIDTGTGRQISRLALAVFQLFGCCGYARVDLRMDSEGRLNVIEVNPNPDISPGAGAVRQAEAAGMNYTQFVAKILSLALEGKKK
jgi:D-alanine-D-alanine ligase